MSESNDLNQTTLDYYFGWMQNNPTWKPEHTIIYAMWAEIERWRGELAEYTVAVQKRDAEIERLRAALVADDEGSTAYQNGWHARDAEIERLRGLLRDARDDVAEIAGQQVKAHRIEQYRRQLAEIDEALGE